MNKRQAEYLAGRLCAREALLKATGTIDVPALGDDRPPQWPTCLVGSITPSDGWAAAIAARRTAYCGLGLDVECLLDEASATHLAGEILTPDELAWCCSRLT